MSHSSAEDKYRLSFTTGGLFWSESIDLAEPLGTETQLFFKLNNKEIISRMYNPRLIKVGEKINFEIDIKKIHFFDHETEKAI